MVVKVYTLYTFFHLLWPIFWELLEDTGEFSWLIGRTQYLFKVLGFGSAEKRQNFPSLAYIFPYVSVFLKTVTSGF